MSLFKWLSRTQKLKVSLYTTVVLSIIIVNIVLYRYDKHNEEQILESLLTGQINYFFNLVNEDLDSITNNKNPKHIKLLKNYELTYRNKDYYNSFTEFVHSKNNEKIVVDLLSAIQLLETLGKELFGYCMYVNSRMLACSNPGDKYKFNFNKIISDLNFNVQISPNENSVLVIESQQRTHRRCLERVVISLLIFFLIVYVLLSKFRSENLANLYKENIRKIKTYYDDEKSFILNCYEYSKEDIELISRLNEAGLIEDDKSNDYLPLFLLQSTRKNTVNYFDIDELKLTQLVNGYNLLNNSSISLFIENKTSSNNIKSFLENELFVQLIKSILKNFLQLKKNCKDAMIKVTFVENEVIWECNFTKITKSFLIKWSKTTFNNTGNLFILNFKQIFQICKVFNIGTEVTNNNTKLIFKIIFDTVELNNDNESKVNNVISFMGKNPKK